MNYDIWVSAQWPAWGKSSRCFASRVKKVKPPGEDGCVSARGFHKQSSLVVRADVWGEVGWGLINGSAFAVMQSKLTGPFNNIYFLSSCWLQPGPCLKLKCVVSAPLASPKQNCKKNNVFKEDSWTCNPVRMGCIKSCTSSYLILHMTVTKSIAFLFTVKYREHRAMNQKRVRSH